MKTETITEKYFSNIFLTGAILCAQIDVNGLLDYGLRAVIGGAVWLGFKILADQWERKKRET